MRTIEVQYMVEAAVTADNTCDTKPLRVGLDIGSTTVKAVVMGEHHELLDSIYRSNSGNPVPIVRDYLLELGRK